MVQLRARIDIYLFIEINLIVDIHPMKIETYNYYHYQTKLWTRGK